MTNIITQLDFYFTPLWQLSGIGFIFLVGIFVECSFLTKWGDFYGRRPVFLLGYFMNFVFIIALMYSHNLILDYFVLFGLGISIAARYYVGYTYNVEMCPKPQQIWVSVFQFIMESVVSLLICVYFEWISKNWVPLMYPDLALTFIGFMYVFFMPETPRFLVSTKRFDEARVVFAKIARINRTAVNTEIFLFENEVELEVKEEQ